MKGLKFRIYPTETQIRQIQVNCSCSRFVYNRMLDLHEQAYRKDGRSLSYGTMANMLPSLKKEEATSFLKEADSMCLQEAVRDLDIAFQNFFAHRAKYPRFKKRKTMYSMTYRTRNQANGIRVTDRNHIHLPVLGSVKIRLSRTIDGKINNATISVAPTGKYFVSLCVSEWQPYKKGSSTYRDRTGCRTCRILYGQQRQMRVCTKAACKVSEVPCKSTEKTFPHERARQKGKYSTVAVQKLSEAESSRSEDTRENRQCKKRFSS